RLCGLRPIACQDGRERNTAIQKDLAEEGSCDTSRSFWMSNPSRWKRPRYRALNGESVKPTPPRVKTKANSVWSGRWMNKKPAPQHRLEPTSYSPSFISGKVRAA